MKNIPLPVPIVPLPGMTGALSKHPPGCVTIPDETLAKFREFALDAMMEGQHPVMGLGARWYLSFKPKWLVPPFKEGKPVAGTNFHVMPIEDVIGMTRVGLNHEERFTMLDHGETCPMPVLNRDNELKWRTLQARIRPEYITGWLEKARFNGSGLSEDASHSANHAELAFQRANDVLCQHHSPFVTQADVPAGWSGGSDLKAEEPTQ